MKILAHASEGIGNNLNFSPVVITLRYLYPDAEIHVLTFHPDLWDGMPEVDKTLQIGKQTFSELYDLLVPSFFNYEHERQGLRAKEIWVPPEWETIPRGALHETLRNFMAIRADLGEGYVIPKRTMAPLDIDNPDELGLPDDGVLIGVAPGGKTNWQWARKRWPYFKSLINIALLREAAFPYEDNLLNFKEFRNKVHFIILGGPDEVKEWRGWKVDAKLAHGQLFNHVGRYSLKETAYILSQCNAVITNDCGPGHMASVLGVPTYMIFGPTSLAKNKPLEPNTQVITKGAWCSPCQYTERWEACHEFECMSRITPEEILVRVPELWEEDTSLAIKKSMWDSVFEKG